MAATADFTTAELIFDSLRGVRADRPAWQEELARVKLLSDRESDVFELLGEGESNRAIAARLCVTERTVKAHVAQILAKLRVESRLQAGLVSYAWTETLKSPDERLR